ncbi:MAG: GNAT family N-acetyltransferase [Marmoricola sp.]
MSEPVNEPVTVRDWQDADWADFAPIFREVVEEGRTYAIDRDIDDAAARAFWGEATHWISAESGGRLLGAAKMGPNRPAQGSHVGTASFMVGSGARGRGVGRALGECAVDWHRKAGFRAIQFNAVVSSNHPAVALWRSLGFEVVGTVPEAFELPDGSRVALLVMYLDLTRSA